MTRISRREAEVLEALGDHLTNAEIAERLFISVRTVESHVSTLLRKLDVDDRRALARVAHEHAEAGSPTSNLPQALTSFLGREGVVATTLAALDAGHLVTLSGTGGVGKTRLAIESGRRLVERGGQSVWLVDLAPITDGSGVLPAIDAALGHPAEPGHAPIDALIPELERRPSVVILDNCEHVIDAVADIAARLLARTRDLRLLLTSREALGMPGERVIAVQPLRVPPEQVTDPAEVAANDGVRLFTDRARSVDPAFAPDRSAPAVASIVRHLDGLPLALELAAAQVMALSPQQIDLRLRDRFALLSARSNDPRHGTLATMLDWSYQLLTANERTVLDRLSVFRGSFSIEAAETVAAPDAEPLPVASILTSLVRKSLVAVDDRGTERRYRLLETVREFGWRRLAESGDLVASRDRHLAWALDLARRAEVGLGGLDQPNWLDRLDDDLDNLEAAFAWSVEDPERAGRALKVVVGLYHYWMARGTRRSQGVRWSESIAAAATDTERSRRTRSLLSAVSLAMWSDLRAGESLAETAVRLAGDDELARLHGEIGLAWIAGLRGREPASLADRFRAAGGDEGMLRWMRGLDVMFRGMSSPPSESWRGLGAVTDEWLETGNEHLYGGFLGYVVDFGARAGEQATAAQARRALDIARQFACASCESAALASLALLDSCDDLGGRVAATQRGVQLADGIGEVFNVYGAMDVLTDALADAGASEEALLIGLGVAASRATTGYVQVLPGREAGRVRGIDRARTDLGPLRSAELEAEAAGIGYRDLVALALG